MIRDVQAMCGSWRSTIAPTEAKAEPVARKVPDRAQELRGVDLAVAAVVCRMKGQGRGIDAKVKSDGAADHHQQQKNPATSGGRRSSPRERRQTSRSQPRPSQAQGVPET
jgi:hypothetical protein